MRRKEVSGQACGTFNPPAVASDRVPFHTTFVMANLGIPAPYEPEKTEFLHNRSNRPSGPAVSRLEMGKRWGSIALGIALSLGLTAVLFSVRNSWENHREWLVTVIPVLVIAGIALDHLLWRRQVIPLVPGLAFLFLALIFAGGDLLADNRGSSDTARDVLSILGGICLAIATLALSIALIWVEARRPTKAPPPQL